MSNQMWDSGVRIRTVKFWFADSLSSLVPLHVQKKLVPLWNVESLRSYLLDLPCAPSQAVILVATSYTHHNNRTVVNGWCHIDSLKILPSGTVYVCFAEQNDGECRQAAMQQTWHKHPDLPCGCMVDNCCMLLHLLDADVARALGVRVLRVFYADRPTFIPPDTASSMHVDEAVKLYMQVPDTCGSVGAPCKQLSTTTCYTPFSLQPLLTHTMQRRSQLHGVSLAWRQLTSCEQQCPKC